MPSKIVPLETFQLCKGFKFDNDEQLKNIHLKFLQFETSQFSKASISINDWQYKNILSKLTPLKIF